jgi:cytochrome P450
MTLFQPPRWPANAKLRDFETGSLQLMTRPLNFLTARKAYLGREAVQAALRAYFYAGYDLNDDTSMLIKARAAVNRKWGLSPDIIGNSELGMIFVSATNAIPTLFWVFCFIFSDPKLRDELRAEVAAVAERQDSDKCVLDITKFPHICPLLNSAYQEAMRLTSIQTGTRFVMEDTILEQPGYNGMPPKTVLLRKGATIQMPSGIVHVATENWGADAHAFDPRRFVKAEKKEFSSAKSQAEQEKLQKKSFYPFGGGRHLCPGRHFAYAEILGAIAVLLLGYDITDANGGIITVPQRLDASFGGGMKRPLGREAHMQVRIRRKAGWEKVTWAFSVKEVKKGD